MNWILQEIVHLMEVLGLALLALEVIPAIGAFRSKAGGKALRDIATPLSPQRGGTGFASQPEQARVGLVRLMTLAERLYVLPGLLIGCGVYGLLRRVHGKAQP